MGDLPPRVGDLPLVFSLYYKLRRTTLKQTLPMLMWLYSQTGQPDNNPPLVVVAAVVRRRLPLPAVACCPRRLRRLPCHQQPPSAVARPHNNQPEQMRGALIILAGVRRRQQRTMTVTLTPALRRWDLAIRGLRNGRKWRRRQRQSDASCQRLPTSE
jgi:hypothetical protein